VSQQIVKNQYEMDKQIIDQTYPSS